MSYFGLVVQRLYILVINRSCSEHFLRSRRPLLLHLPTPSEPIIFIQVWWPVSASALKSPRISLSVRGLAEKILSPSSQNLSFTSSELVIVGA